MKIKFWSQQRRFPYESGDVTVLGPETIIDATRTVIAHKGVNYYTRDADEAARLAVAVLLERTP